MSQRFYSYGDGGGGGGGASDKLYLCYQCNRTVSITPSPSQLFCPDCNGGFLEEYENTNPNPNPFLGFNDYDDDDGDDYGGDFQNPTDLSALFGGSLSRSGSSGEFNPFAFLQNYLTTLRAGGANIQFVIENANDSHSDSDPSASGFRLPSNLGDYFVGPGLEQLIQQLAENDPNRYGTPPASKSVLLNLPNIKITNDQLHSDYSDCAVCKDSFQLHEDAKQLPCNHVYHHHCILPWLEMHNSCPVCRFELPTDDADYENRSRQGSGGGAASGSADPQENPDTPRSMERRFRINLPWPFTGFGASPETSNTGGAGNNNNSNSGSGSQARQEDLG